MTTTKEWERHFTKLLADCKALTILSLQIDRFESLYGHKPELCRMTVTLAPAIIKELMRNFDLPAHTAILQPIWFNDVPIIFTLPTDGEILMQLQYGGTKLTATL